MDRVGEREKEGERERERERGEWTVAGVLQVCPVPTKPNPNNSKHQQYIEDTLQVIQGCSPDKHATYSSRERAHARALCSSTLHAYRESILELPGEYPLYIVGVWNCWGLVWLGQDTPVERRPQSTRLALALALSLPPFLSLPPYPRQGQPVTDFFKAWSWTCVPLLQREKERRRRRRFC